eukprot:4043164-Pleurochrysis_carterae.AAC.1
MAPRYGFALPHVLTHRPTRRYTNILVSLHAHRCICTDPAALIPYFQPGIFDWMAKQVHDAFAQYAESHVGDWRGRSFACMQKGWLAPRMRSIETAYASHSMIQIESGTAVLPSACNVLTCSAPSQSDFFQSARVDVNSRMHLIYFDLAVCVDGLDSRFSAQRIHASPRNAFAELLHCIKHCG